MAIRKFINMTETEKAIKAIVTAGELIKVEPVEKMPEILRNLQSVLARWIVLYGKEANYYSEQGSLPSKTGTPRGRPKLSTGK